MNTMQKLRIFSLSLLLLSGLSAQEKVEAQPGASISFQTFYNELAPYGRWINSPQYGSVWTPYVDPGFQPYSTNGYWEVTEFGNTWVSDYNWGWAAFHYGRWSYDDYNGWFWIPGYEWGPAWVNWRTGGEYYGWAPLGPGMNINISVNIPSFWWVFVPQRYIASRSWYNYCAPRNRVSYIYNQTTIINNYYQHNNRSYAYGPRRDEIERVTRRNVPVRQIDMNQRGRVITDRSSRGNGGYDAPDHNGPVYQRNGRQSTNDSRYNNGGRSNADRYDNGVPNGRNGNSPSGNNSGGNSGRTGSSNGGYQSPERNSPYSSPAQRNSPATSPSNNGSSRDYEPARQGNSPSVEPNRGTSSPSYNSESSRSGRSSDRGGSSNSGRTQESAPAVRSAPAERNSGSREAAPRGESSRSDNSGGNSRSERSGRSPR
ncbi:DUF6600 domain-containing protein [Dyadobacter sp. NIV53]|uniref:DUF6600 domain-containing protein n=1 Tax=Dyadobacter sp. NIV53 TaxID=2861765 RepID=UPI001C86B976|nr:DUF6600 domain-containing protein [Dyadobacter sp. NIV53]